MNWLTYSIDSIGYHAYLSPFGRRWVRPRARECSGACCATSKPPWRNVPRSFTPAIERYTEIFGEGFRTSPEKVEFVIGRAIFHAPSAG